MSKKLYYNLNVKNFIKEDRKMQLDYFYGIEGEQFSFFRIPKTLFTDERFKNISLGAKVLYGLFIDRISLSSKNGWIDESGRVFIIFKIEDIMSAIGFADRKVNQLLNELENEYGLIERKRQGLGKPNIIYVKNIHTISDTHKSRFQKRINHDSGYAQNTILDTHKSRCNNTDFSNTNFNNNQSINQDNNYNIYNISTAEKWIDRYNQTISEIKKQIDYDYLINTAERDIVDEVVNIMADVMTVYRPKYKIEGELIDFEAVVNNFQKITADKLEICLIAYNRRTQKISNPKAYWITVLYNIPLTSQLTLQNMINNDMYEAGG